MDASRSESPSGADDGEPDDRWHAVVARDGAFDGRFFYCVKTTGVYCNPSCAARRPRRENVTFAGTPQEAERAGYRPCKRCEPGRPSLHERNAETVATICRLIETADDVPPLETLARVAGSSVYHFHRMFKSITGVTPRAYASAHRAKRVRDELTHGEATVTAALYEAGFNAHATFYNAAGDMLGMTPSDYRAGGANAQIHFAIGECSLGSILVAKSERGICAIQLGDDPETLARELQDRFPQAEFFGADGAFEETVARVVGFVEAPALGLDLPLDVRGTAFTRRVWEALRAIPVGSTATYTEIAQRIGAPKSVRAVARACAGNLLAVAIPCHRVVRRDGTVAGYRWGVERKRALLAREATP